MIHIFEDLYIDSDDLQYILKKDLHRKDKKKKPDGTYEEIDAYRTISYHSTIAGAITSVLRGKHMEYVHKSDTELSEALELIREYDQAMIEAMRKIIPESEMPNVK